MFSKAEIKTHCGRDSSKEKHPGETIHCLMKAAMEEDKRRESKDRSKEVTFGRQCEDALNRLLDAAQIASDWKVKHCERGKFQILNIQLIRLTLFWRIPVRMLYLQLVTQSKQPQIE